MRRRSFLKHLAASGLALNLPVISGNLHASSLPEKFLIVVHANGGWDPTSLCDPKGLNEAYADRSSFHNGSTNSVALNPSKKIGDIRWSDIPDVEGLDWSVAQRSQTQIDGFFSAYGDRLTVINGIDTSTNSHNVGRRHVWSGHIDVSHPSISAYYAGAVAPYLPMAFMSNGGFDYTGSVVARTRAKSPTLISEISEPNVTYGGRNVLHVDDNMDVYAEVMLAQKARLQRQLQSETLEKRRSQLGQLFGVRSSEADLGAMAPYLADIQDNVSPDDHWNVDRADNFKIQAQIVAAAMKANLAVSANLYMPGFDTHDRHDAVSYPQMGDLLEGIHYLMVVLEHLGIREKVTVVMGSDFGRTPFYNAGKGKDHWPLTSMMVLQGGNTVTNGRVFGATSDDFNVEKINVTSGLPDSSGLVLEPAHVNQELRKLLGVADHPLAELFPLPESNFNIFV